MPNFNPRANKTGGATIPDMTPTPTVEAVDFSGAFHWQNGIFFQRTAAGIRVILPDDIAPVFFDIPWSEWQSIVNYAAQGPLQE